MWAKQWELPSGWINCFNGREQSGEMSSVNKQPHRLILKKTQNLSFWNADALFRASLRASTCPSSVAFLWSHDWKGDAGVFIILLCEGFILLLGPQIHSSWFGLHLRDAARSSSPFQERLPRLHGPSQQWGWACTPNRHIHMHRIPMHIYAYVHRCSYICTWLATQTENTALTQAQLKRPDPVPLSGWWGWNPISGKYVNIYAHMTCSCPWIPVSLAAGTGTQAPPRLPPQFSCWYSDLHTHPQYTHPLWGSGTRHCQTQQPVYIFYPLFSPVFHTLPSFNDLDASLCPTFSSSHKHPISRIHAQNALPSTP